jgi:mercuric ion binding protein
MKTRMLSLIMIVGLCTTALFGQSVKKESFKVAGNCDMCKTRIEKAAKSVEGVSSADWNQETKMIEVSFNPEKADLDKINRAIAEAGHDTQMYRAKDEVYEKLPACCKYERMEQDQDNT